jgi:hypothetical protein
MNNARFVRLLSVFACAFLMVGSETRSFAQTAEEVSLGYSVFHEPGFQYKFYKGDHHFLSLIYDGGIFDFRPHPGCDINGWGSSWFAQPFFPGAELKHTEVQSVSVDSGGVHVNASGLVSKGGDDTYGNWSSAYEFTYEESGQFVSGTGSYNIDLPGKVSGGGGDLNLYKIASNYLDNVPLLNGGLGDTGDMGNAVVQGSNSWSNFTWYPPLVPGHFPTDENSWLSISVKGKYNQVDTVAQGYARIEPACKPSLKVEIHSKGPTGEIRFGGYYLTSDREKFWTDNVGITPFINAGSTETSFRYDVQFDSFALPGCCDGLTILPDEDSLLTVHLTVTTNGGEKMRVDWGDGRSAEEYPAGVFQASYTYLKAGSRNVVVWIMKDGEWRNTANCQATLQIGGMRRTFIPITVR